MAAKRLREGGDKDSDKPEEKRTALRALPVFSTINREAVMPKQLQNFLESFFRRVVREEVEGVLVNGPSTTHLLIPRSSQLMQIEAAEQSSYLQLVFAEPPSFPIYTGSKIEDSNGNPLKIQLIGTHNGAASLATLSKPLRLEVVVLDGDFPSQGQDQNWTSDEFSRRIVRKRTGKRPLLTGDVSLTLREGVTTIGELILTDNSSWIRSQHFRIGVRVVPGSYDGPRIKEGMTASFRVKDHRGESYRKHYPPILTDEVWRLVRIGKDGAFHSRLSARNINTVQDFLKLLSIDAAQLRTILGVGMSERMWESTIAHARTCEVGNKLYTYRNENCTIFLSSVCQVVRIEINGMACSPEGLDRSQKAYVQEMVREAYAHWNLLVESDGLAWTSTALLQNEPAVILEEAIEASTSWYPGQLESPEFQIEEFEEVDTISTTMKTQWSHANNIFP
ncbi:protein SAR DEFICIENT 1-like [Iris pallida]|uniref:Protein SAR DEFICIENT 1-like n=1 Tax=Iris pallida TaxID=29817 RepID=A0AAX6FAM5_IRIPA|nr:protein SAR DEFICIENT 1-like [Iris pallida]